MTTQIIREMLVTIFRQMTVESEMVRDAGTTWYGMQELHGTGCRNYMVRDAGTTWYGMQELHGRDAGTTWYGMQELHGTG